MTGENNLKAFSRAIDRFCQKHRKFGIPRMMLYIVFISAGVFVLGLITAGDVLRSLAFLPGRIFEHGEVWRLITWVFLPLTNNI